MKSPDEQAYISLKLRQARRAERPYTLLKLIFIFAALMTLAALLNNCCSGVTSSPTPAQRKQAVDAIWNGDKEAHERKIP